MIQGTFLELYVSAQLSELERRAHHLIPPYRTPPWARRWSWLAPFHQAISVSRTLNYHRRVGLSSEAEAEKQRPGLAG